MSPIGLRSLTTSLVIAVLLIACSGLGVAPGDTVERVVVDPPSAQVAVNTATSLSASVLDGSGGELDDRPVHWAVEDPSILSVAANGVVTGLRLGSTQVAASSGGKSGLAMITVVPVAVATVEVLPDNLSMLLGQSRSLTAVTRDASGNILTGRPVSWSTNNPSVATVSKRGVVTALSPGGAIITAQSEGKNGLASVTVSTLPIAVGTDRAPRG